MRTLHLISDGRMCHTIHLGDSNTKRYDEAIEHLKFEATGIMNTIIICDNNNMPSNFINFATSPTEVLEDSINGYMMFGIAIALLLAYMIII